MAEHQKYIGQCVGDYRLLRRLGRGGFGNISLAEQRYEPRQVAVKVLQIWMSQPDDFRSFLSEARTMQSGPPHIMPLLNVGLSHDDIPVLVMKYASDGTLRQQHPKGSRVPLACVVTDASQIGSALQYAYEQHLIHRDVKPESMLLRADETLLLSDIGIAPAIQSTPHRRSRTNHASCAGHL